MKLILATPVYSPEVGGPATYTKELCERISSDHEIIVAAYANSAIPLPGTSLVSVSKHRRLPIRLLEYFFVIIKASRDADLIYVQNAMAAGLPVAVASMILRVPFMIKFVGDEAWERATQHNLTSKRLEEFLANPEGNFKIKAMMKIQGFVLRRAARVMTPSAYLKELISKTYNINLEKIVVNYNATEEPDFIPITPDMKKHQILTTARLVKWKGIDGIIKALAILKNKFPDASLVVAGDGPEMDELKKTAQNSGVQDKVIFLGNVSRAETWQLRKSSEVYVLNSSYEGLPHTVLTSFAAQIPVIATDILGTNEAVYDQKTGLLVEPEDNEALANAIEKLFTDDDLKKKLIKGGIQILNDKFSWQAHLKILNNIFGSILAKPSDKSV